ncbi:hypothetical protein BS50DRAFT_585247 [Corynespora cassiicola Philippines]|uniref:DUF7779 domain-containing protein n=1 Tax=Corynespora cassiicola Philippines TaxID=1448308 RepID=A0A2T2NWA8_CORCC|nr:hypothetical protein BS50DRAFT_585247 [Corynespora cassiicola Philippines]
MFSSDRGSNFLRYIIPRDRYLTNEDQKSIEWISFNFGGLPLALKQVGAFITHKNCSPSHYKRLYQQLYEKIDQYKLPCASENERSVADVWQLSKNSLTEDSRILLDTLSLFDPDSIPTELFEFECINHSYSEMVKDPLRCLDAQEGLLSQSLIELDHGSSSFSIHRLLQETTFRKLKKDVPRLQETLLFSINMIQDLSPEINLSLIRNPQQWKPMEKVLSHVQRIYDRCKDFITETEAPILLRIMTKILNYSFESSQIILGDRSFEDIQEIVLKISQPDPEIMALAYLRQALHEIQLSYKHVERAANKNPTLLNTTLYVRILSNLGITHTAVELFDKAEEYHLRAIAHCKALKMEKECSMGNLVQNLANCYLWGGRMDDAQRALTEAYTCPVTSPSAIDYTLGNWMMKKHRYDEAAQLHMKALEQYTNELGQKHPVTADSWHKMGTLFATEEYSKHDIQKAEIRHCFRQTIEIWETLAQKPSSVADLFISRARWSLASLLKKKEPSKCEESDKMMKEVEVFLNTRFPDGLPSGLAPAAAIESLITYWSK